MSIAVFIVFAKALKEKDKRLTNTNKTATNIELIFFIIHLINYIYISSILAPTLDNFSHMLSYPLKIYFILSI